MGVSIFRQISVHLVRCEKCQKLSHYSYRMKLGGYPYSFCSGICADNARRNYEEKEANGITPNNLTPITEEDENEEGLKDYG